MSDDLVILSDIASESGTKLYCEVRDFSNKNDFKSRELEKELASKQIKIEDLGKTAKLSSSYVLRFFEKSKAHNQPALDALLLLL